MDRGRVVTIVGALILVAAQAYTEPCAETLFGCCKSDNKTAAQGNDQEGCPPPPPPACVSSQYVCTQDIETEANGPGEDGRSELTTTINKTEETETSFNISSTESIDGCAGTEYGCCFDNETVATGPELQGCPCNTSEFGCCPGSVTAARGPSFEGCVKSCNTSANGCCPDGKTSANGINHEGCCLLYAYGCCPDDYTPADGPHLEGCGCQQLRFGCCPDNVTVATGLDNKGCGCQYTEHGCCPDRHSEASGSDFEGCMCHTYQFGCCPDGVTIARGPNGQGCYCQQSIYGCCGDEQTQAKGPNKEGCDCATSKHGCCPDGTTEATGSKFEGCSDIPENKQAACSLKFQRGRCRNNSFVWFYDTEYGGCSQFWYGGCEGNENRFTSKDDCEDTCVRPSSKDVCKLPQIKGSCLGNIVRWFYDSNRETCTNFIYGGCLGNNNNFETRELCQAQCEPERVLDQCDLAIESGSCAGNYPRWGFNKELRHCEEFVWGGCEGNSNRFSTEAACLLRCNPPKEPQRIESSTELTTTEASTGLKPCSETLFGCCESDNNTAAQGNDQEGCPPPPSAYVSSKYGCCKDNETEATGPGRDGYSELTTTIQYTKETETSTNVSPKESTEGCAASEYGCCFDNETAATGPELQGCPCNTSEFGCCPDGVAAAQGPSFEGCVKSCNKFAHGCCHDGKTPAHGPGHEGCCLLYAYGCCPDNYMPAYGPRLEGCECQYSRFGCCPDNVTVATGPDNTGCSCQYTKHGCCPDRHSEASGPDFEGCMCHTYQFGCCPDGVTIAHGLDDQGCFCQQSINGCCGDEQTHAKGPNKEGCDCATSKYGCCPDGTTEATGSNFEGCTDKPKNKHAACSLKSEGGRCFNYSVNWFYDTKYGGCSQFWYGGCEGNENRFASKDDCEATCVRPPPKDACKLPQIKGSCLSNVVRWFYDSKRDSCAYFIYSGCLGNNNNFETRELCQAQCEPAKRALDQCDLAIERGSCAGNYPRWGFNKESRRCEEFIWGGCEGNSNRFSTEAACLLRCNPPREPQRTAECSETQDVGNCTNTEALWSFSQSENRCVPFYYTGCGGNGNKYRTKKECQLACPTAFVPELCTLPASTGDCYDNKEKWYFDTKDQRCRQFFYGGCGGNDNKFDTEQQCINRCSALLVTTPTPTAAAFTQPQQDPDQQDICQLPMQEGPCDDSVISWFYDEGSDSCSQFTYGGCEGNENRFASHEACEDRCKSGPSASTAVFDNHISVDLPSECSISETLGACSRKTVGVIWYYEPSSDVCIDHENLDTGVECRTTGVFYSQEACERSCGVFRNIDVCRYPLDPGPCDELWSKYHYNETSRRCEEFAYSGCLGGPNRFSSEQECQQICMVNVDPCTVPVEPGNCLGRVVVWYYDQNRDSCYQFAYSGCGGNNNKFQSRELCEGQCRKQEPVEITTTTPLSVQTTIRQPEPSDECRTPSLEPCGTNVTAFYFDERTGRCDAADIGACQYSNWFRTEEECERRCGVFKGLDVCNAQLDPGSCRASIPKYYFDAASGRCKLYAYGGCEGGSNRFSTRAECEEICVGADPVPVCLAPVATGELCGAPPELRWHYDETSADCLVFTYLGCGGSENNFVSYEECAYLCRLAKPEVIHIPAKCVDNPTFANCALIVRSRFCKNKLYSKFCCKSCVEAGQLNPHDVEMQADQHFRMK